MVSKAQMMPPDFFQPAVKEATDIIKKPKEGDDDLLLSMAESDAWAHLKELVQGTINALNQETKRKVAVAKTMEEVGMRYLIRDVSVDSMNSILNMVELRKQAKYAQKPLRQEE